MHDNNIEISDYVTITITNVEYFSVSSCHAVVGWRDGHKLVVSEQDGTVQLEVAYLKGATAYFGPGEVFYTVFDYPVTTGELHYPNNTITNTTLQIRSYIPGYVACNCECKLNHMHAHTIQFVMQVC